MDDFTMDDYTMERFLMENLTMDNSTMDGSGDSFVFQFASKALLFVLVFGLAGSVELSHLKTKFKNKKGILAGVLCQFFLLPLLGFIVVISMELEPVYAIMILVTVSSPGGSYSNWWCSLCNADLALSVAMTTVSNILAIAMLPLNILLYIQVLYPRLSQFAGLDSAPQLNWLDLLTTLGLVLLAIGLGVFSGHKWPQYVNWYNRVGNICGFALIVLGLFASGSSSKPWYAYDGVVILAVSIPPCCAIVLAFLFGKLFKLGKPERVAVGIETSYQNTGLALTVALSLDGQNGIEGGVAAGVPSIYQFVVIGILTVFAITSWQAGWTFAPRKDNFFKVIFDNYQPAVELEDDEDEYESDGELTPRGRLSISALHDNPNRTDDDKEGNVSL